MEAKLGMSVTEQEDQYSQELEDQEMEMASRRLCDETLRNADFSV